MTMTNYTNNNARERFTSMNFAVMVCKFIYLFIYLFLLLLHGFFFLISSSSSKTATRVIHYMITSSKTHKNAHPIC